MTKNNEVESSQALPVGAVLDAEAHYPSPILAAYRAWVAARRDLMAEIEAHGTGDTEAGRGAQRREARAAETIRDLRPQTLAEAEALAHLIWDHHKPGAAEGTPQFERSMQDPGRQLVLRMWQAASGMSGYPIL
ncbi:hypothetical protein CDZ97_11295 [Mameliella alba]|uniref:hypothetical protein n=1 Tax=Mameliella alba TaxID=561184 RepID=UPI000B531016|nr:hypothetical protein [Mameliella alba]OWV64450.1 hypothetical protein CDZ97_11295 [Mameliella alba]